MSSALYFLPDTLPLRGVVSLPDLPAGAQQSPLLVFLHGLNEGPPTEVRAALTRHGPLRAGSAAIARERFVVLAPQLPRRGDYWSLFIAEVETLVDFACAQWRVDPDRVYLTGFSLGGDGVFDLALLAPERWAALWPVDPTHVPPRDPRLPLWLSLGTAARGKTAEFAEHLRLNHSGFGAGSLVYHDDGLDHVDTARLAYADASIYGWLLARRRTATRVQYVHARRTGIS
jgi:predicted peptidase